jgi:general secretion pathway protein G
MDFMSGRRLKIGRGFSLIELVIVVVIIGVIAAIAIPRMQNVGRQTGVSALRMNLKEMRRAIDHYHAEHGAYPLLAKLTDQLTKYTDISGNVSATGDATFMYGPYIKAIPEVTVGGYAGRKKVAAVDGPAIGWTYNETTGEFKTTATETDSKGVLYSSY